MALHVLSVLAVLLSGLAARADPKPHIIMILQDDLGYHDTVFNGGTTTEETSNISALAQQGIILKNAYTHWHCSPTRRSFLSGRWPIHHGEQLSAVASDDMDLRWTWISEKLKAAGYATHWYGKGHTGYLSWNHLPINRGFDHYLGYLSGAEAYRSSERWEGDHPLTNNTEYSSDLYGQLAVDAIANHDAETPLFMYLAWQAVHTPYDPVPDWDDRYCYGYSEQENGNKSTYCGMLWASDMYFGKLVQALRDKGMWDNTLIVYSSDNGGVEDGINYPLRGEKHSNWQGGMHVASFVSGGLVPANLRGSESFVNVHIADWYPTFAKLAGQDPADDPPVAPLPVDLQDVNKDIYGNSSFPPVDGVDVWPFISNASYARQTDAAHPFLVLSKEVIVAGDIKLLVAQNNFKTQNNGWKYPNGSWIASDDALWPCNQQDGPLDQVLPGVPGQPPCLFNVTADPREMSNLAPVNAERVTALWRQLNETILTSFLHGKSGPAGNPGEIARCSPASLLGNCNATCAKERFADSLSASMRATCTMRVETGVCAHDSKAGIQVKVNSVDECCLACQNEKSCTHFTVNWEDPPACHLKTGQVGKLVYNANCTSGFTFNDTPCVSFSTPYPVCGIPGC